jgi:hypothetical protein
MGGIIVHRIAEVIFGMLSWTVLDRQAHLEAV